MRVKSSTPIQSGSKLKMKSYSPRFPSRLGRSEADGEAGSLKLKIFLVFIHFAFLIVILHFALCTLHFNHTYAQVNSLSFSVTPPIIELNVNPGETKEGFITITNTSAETLSFTADVYDFVIQNQEQIPVLKQPSESKDKYGAKSWIGILPRTFSIKPYQKTTLTYYIQVPKNANAGGYYAATVITPHDLSNKGSPMTKVQTQLVTLFYITVEGTIHEYAYIKTFGTDFFQEKAPVTISAQIQSLSDVHIRPVGTLTIFDILGRKIVTQPLAQGNIFPNTLKNYQNKINNKVIPGYFTAKLEAYYGNDKKPLMASFSFILFPWKRILLTSIVIISTLLFTFLSITIYKRIHHQ